MRYIFVLTLISFNFILPAQEKNTIAQDPESYFDNARRLSESGETEEAIRICREIIKTHSDYYDVVIYLSQLYGRDGEYQQAVTLLTPVLLLAPPLNEAHAAICNIYYWSNEWQKLVEATSEALQHYPSDPDFLYLNALALHKLGRQSDALNALDAVLLEEPGHVRASGLIDQIYSEGDFVEVFATYNFDYFEQPYNRSWHQLTAGVVLPFEHVKLSPYISAGHAIDPDNLFISTSAGQVNLDGYIDLTESSYALLGYGFGSGTYLPWHRAILHYWQDLPAAWTVSAGVRYFYFNQHFLFYAFGIEKYAGNYWFELKNYLFRKEYGLSAAFHLSARRYFENQEHYLGFSAGYGTSPDEPVTIASDFDRLNALSFRLYYSRQLGSRSVFEIGAGYLHDQYKDQFGEASFRNRYNGFMKYSYKIK